MKNYKHLVLALISSADRILSQTFNPLVIFYNSSFFLFFIIYISNIIFKLDRYNCKSRFTTTISLKPLILIISPLLLLSKKGASHICRKILNTNKHTLILDRTRDLAYFRVPLKILPYLHGRPLENIANSSFKKKVNSEINCQAV